MGRVARGEHGPTPPRRRSPYSAPTERGFGNQPLALTPAVEAIEAGDCPVPACRADPLGGVAAPPRAVIGGHIVAGRVPYRRAAGIEEAKPHRNVIGAGAPRTPRADPLSRQVTHEVVEIKPVTRQVREECESIG